VSAIEQSELDNAYDQGQLSLLEHVPVEQLLEKNDTNFAAAKTLY
jgi:hypothetical protein